MESKARNPPPALDSSDLPVRLFLLRESVPLGTFRDEWVMRFSVNVLQGGLYL